MATVEVTKLLGAPATRVWQTISSFHGIEQWLPILKASHVEGAGVGARRTCTLQDGGEIRERLEEVDAEARRLRYAITEGPLPIAAYVATMTVRPVSAMQCELSWRATFEVSADHEAAMVELLQGAYEAGALGLQRLCAA